MPTTPTSQIIGPDEWQPVTDVLTNQFNVPATAAVLAASIYLAFAFIPNLKETVLDFFKKLIIKLIVRKGD